ncbi:MAG: glycosyltransferase family 1 protein, partial [Acidobacteriota bacterium]|nr:glycosyltransferase family 1 protein [Acidobacteriota bacterium]
MQAYPQFDALPKALFMARAWDTDLIEDKERKADVERINENRAECIRSLRKEFGTRFFGGLAPDDYALKHFKDCLLPDRSIAGKRRYLEILKQFPVCVATTGLNNSNGWKLGEYVAFSKAIVTEPLHFQVTGPFTKEVNYLEFTSSDQAVEAVARLFDDKVFRSEMMINNYRYYQSFIKPDSLILNTLSIVFQHGDLI